MIDTRRIPITDVLRIVKSWVDKYKVLPKGDIVFQNQEFMLNVKFTNESLVKVKKNPRGLENLPEAIANPNEIWASWENPQDQHVVLINYILKDDKHIFVVQTRKGEVVKTMINTIANIDVYRKGIIFVK